MSQSSISKSTLITTTNTNSMDACMHPNPEFLVKRKKEQHVTTMQSPSKPPPILPKPKFILPQSSVTQMALQRNLKAKSELNICTPTSSSAVCSSSSSSTSSCSSSSATNQEPKMINNSNSNNTNANVNGHFVAHHEPIAPSQTIRNKLLENGSLVSSSAGYHSDTWESSHSSRQSFDEQPNSQHQNYRRVGNF